jgi:hypothetical protein
MHPTKRTNQLNTSASLKAVQASPSNLNKAMDLFLQGIIAFCFIFGLAVTTVSAQEASTSDEAAVAPRPIEEITVVGQESLSRLRLRITEKENEIFGFFNANNSSRRMDIICTKRRPTGTYMMKRECEPRFMRERRVELTRDARQGIGVGFTQGDLAGMLAQDFEKLQNEMLTLMLTNKEFAEALADLADLAENHDAHRGLMFDDGQ